MIFYSLTINLSNMRSALKRWTWLLNLTPSSFFCITFCKNNKHTRRHLHICDGTADSDSDVRYIRKKSYFENSFVTNRCNSSCTRLFVIIFCLFLKFKTSFIRILKLLQNLSGRDARHHSPVQSHSWSLKAGRIRTFLLRLHNDPTRIIIVVVDRSAVSLADQFHRWICLFWIELPQKDNSDAHVSV